MTLTLTFPFAVTVTMTLTYADRDFDLDLDLYVGHAGPCSDDIDDEDCGVASGSDIELDVESSSTAATTSTSTVTELSTTRSSTSQTARMSLLTVQLPPKEASVFLDEQGQDQTQENVVVYDGRSQFSTSLGMNIGLIAGIAAGIIILTLVLVYAVRKYRIGRVRRLGRAARRAKAPAPGKEPSVTAETGLLTGAITDHDGRKMTTTPLLYRDPAATNYSSQKTVNGFDSDLRRKRKDVNEWYV